jgi:hypothetical protein
MNSTRQSMNLKKIRPKQTHTLLQHWQLPSALVLQFHHTTPPQKYVPDGLYLLTIAASAQQKKSGDALVHLSAMTPSRPLLLNGSRFPRQSDICILWL